MRVMKPSSCQAHVRVEEIGQGAVLVALSGDLGMGAIQRMDQVFRDLVQSGKVRILVDLSETLFISSAGIGILLASMELAREKGGEIVFVSVPERIRHIFGLMGLAKILRFASDPEEGLRLVG